MTTLAADVRADDPYLVVASTSGLALDEFYQVGTEYVQIRTAPRDAHRIYVARGVLGTTAAAHSAGAAFTPVVVAVQTSAPSSPPTGSVGAPVVGTGDSGVWTTNDNSGTTDGVVSVPTWNTTRHDPNGWLNPDTYDSPDWWGASFAAKQTFVLPPGLYLVGYHFTLAFAAASRGTLVEGDFTPVDNRIASLPANFYTHAPYPPFASSPIQLPTLGYVDTAFPLVVPTDFAPGMVFGTAVRSFWEDSTSFALALYIARLEDWS